MVVDENDNIKNCSTNNPVDPRRLDLRPNHRELCALGGRSTSSEDKSKARRKAWFLQKLKEGYNLSDEEIDFGLEMAQTSESFAMDMIGNVKELQKECNTGQKIALLNIKKDMMKVIHGERLRTENINININSTMEEWERRLYDGEPAKQVNDINENESSR